MPGKLRGKAFKISEDDARSYRYATPLRSNPGVTHIAAINGRGAYSRQAKARDVMAGVSREERAARARQALPNSRSRTMLYYGPGPRKNPSPAQIAARRRFAEMARSGALKRVRRNAGGTVRRSTKARASVSQTRIAGMPVRIIGSVPKAAARRSSIKPVVKTQRGYESPFKGRTGLNQPFGAGAGGGVRRSAFGPKGTARIKSAAKPAAKSAAKPRRQRPAETQGAIERAIKMIERGLYPIGKGITAKVRSAAYKTLGLKKPTKKRKSTPAAAGKKKGSSMAKKAKKSAGRGKKRAAKKTTTKRKSAKRVTAGKKAARTRKRNAAKKATRKVAKKTTKRKSAKRVTAGKKAARTRKRNAAKKATRKVAKKTTKRKSAKRVAAGKKAARTRKRNAAKKGTVRKASPKRKSSKRRTSLTAAHAALRRKMGWRGAATLEREGWAPPKKRRSRKGKKVNANRRRFGSMRKNAMGSSIITALKVGGTITAGFVGHKAISHILNTIVFDRLLTPMLASQAAESAAEETATVAPAAAPAAAAQAAEGVGEIATVVRSTVGGGLAAVAGVMLANALIGDQETKQLVAGGVVASFVHGLLVTALEGLVPDVVPMLSGDGTAARLSAMYGVGASIDPRYTPISGYGEYLAERDAVGEYFESGISGLGNYGANPDIYEAAAGYGSIYEAAAGLGNHIDPSSNLDHELTMAEAAAGVGQLYMPPTVMPPTVTSDQAPALAPYTPIYEAQAGIGEYFESGISGFGDVAALPTADMTVPGGQLWAGARAVTRDQGETALQPAGILETAGGAGILG